MSKKKNRSAKMTATQKADAAARTEQLRQEAIRATDPDAPPAPAATAKPGKAATKPVKGGKAPKAKRSSGLDAAHQVLVKAGKPMNVRDIADAAIKGGSWSSGGKTPHQTLAAAIGREIAGKGKASRFAKAGRGLFAANKQTK